MKKLGRKHRPFFRICAVDSHAPRDGRVLEELGTYDPMISETDARAELNHERFSYWLGVGAQMSDKVKVLFKKYGPEGTHVAARDAALAARTGPRVIPVFGTPAYVPEPEGAEVPAEATKEAEAPAAPVDESVAQEEVAAESGAAESEATKSETAETEAAASAAKEEVAAEGDPAAKAKEDKSE
jgi:small subunit ribosomal protein S16